MIAKTMYVRSYQVLQFEAICDLKPCPDLMVKSRWWYSMATLLFKRGDHSLAPGPPTLAKRILAQAWRSKPVSIGLCP